MGSICAVKYPDSCAREVVEIGAHRFDVALAEAHRKVATRPGALGGEGLAPSTE
jgi:hypothetical protein